MENKHWQHVTQRRISRRSMLNWSARTGVGAAGIALVGCGDDDDDDDEAVAATPAPAAPAPDAPADDSGLPPRPSRDFEGPLLGTDIQANGPYKIGFSYPVFDIPFFTQGVHFGAVQECTRLGIECVFTFGGGYDKPEAQVNDMEDLIAQNPDGIVLTAAGDAALIPVIDKAAANGIVVTSFSIDSESETFFGFEGISHLEQGLQSSQIMIDCLEDRGVTNGKVIAVGGPAGAAWYDPRKEGLDTVFGGSAHEVVSHQYTSSAREETIRVFEDLLTANPDVDGVWTGNADQAMGVIQVLETRGFEAGEVCVVSGAGLSEEYSNRIREGWYFANLTQQAVITGEQAIRKIVAHINGDTSVPFHVIEPFIIITAENVDTVDTSTISAPEGFDPPSRVAPAN